MDRSDAFGSLPRQEDVNESAAPLPAPWLRRLPPPSVTKRHQASSSVTDLPLLACPMACLDWLDWTGLDWNGLGWNGLE